MTTIVQQFKNYLYQVGYSDTIQNMLPACVREYLEFAKVSPEGGDLEGAVEQQKVRSFYEWLQIRPLKKRTGALSEMMIQHYVYALKTFFGWLEVTGQADYNPISGMKFKRPAQNTREPLTLEQIQELFTAATALKETALLHLFYSCGLRRSEGEALNIRDVHFREQLLYVREGKGSKRRVIPMTEKVTANLEDYYLNERCGPHSSPIGGSWKGADTEAFILNRRGTRMSGDGYIKLLKRIADKAGIMQEVTLHHLRHSIATHLLQSGMSMEYVRDFLGHEHLESTQVYAKPDAEQLKLL